MGIRASRFKRPETKSTISNTGLRPTLLRCDEKRNHFKKNDEVQRETVKSHYDDIEISCTNVVRKEIDTSLNDYCYLPKLRTQSDDNIQDNEALTKFENESAEDNGTLFDDLCQHIEGLSVHDWFELIKSRNGCVDQHCSVSTSTGNDSHIEPDSEATPCSYGQIYSKEYIIQQTVDACRTFFEECLRVTEVLPYLLFLEDIELIKSKERESPKQAAGLLLDQLKASNEVGKWTTFLNALNFTGYQYLASIANGNTIFDISKHKNLLKIFTPQIVTSLLPSDIIHHLYEKNVISATDLEEIACELRNRGSTIASLMLLDRIPRRHPNWYNEFLNALRACHFDFIADTLDVTEPDQQYTDIFMSESDALVQESTPKPDDWSYITPTYSSSERSIEPNPVPPPVPKRPQIHRNASLHKRSIPRPQSTASSSKTNLCVRTSSIIDFINEKKRLSLELIDIREKSRLHKEIRALVNEHVDAMKEVEDEKGIHMCEQIVETTVKKPENRISYIIDIAIADKAIQVQEDDFHEDCFSLTETVSKGSGMSTHTRTDIYNLSREKMKKDIMDDIKSQMYEEVKLALGIRMLANENYQNMATEQSAKDTVQKLEYDLAAALPESHVLLDNQSADSGLCSDC